MVVAHENGVIKLKVTGHGFHNFVVRVQLFHAGVGHVGDGVVVQLVKRHAVAAANRHDARLGVEDQNLRRDFVFLKIVGHQTGPLIGRRRAAVRWRRQRHDKGAALEAFDFLLQSPVLGAGHIGAGEMLVRIGRSRAVVAKPGFVRHANAGRDHQPVVIHKTLARVHALFVAVNVGDFGLHIGVTQTLGRSGVRMHQERGVDHVHQPFVAQGARPEQRVLFQEHHFQFGRVFAQMARRGQAAPAAAQDDNAAFFALGHQLRGG